MQSAGRVGNRSVRARGLGFDLNPQLLDVVVGEAGHVADFGSRDHVLLRCLEVRLPQEQAGLDDEGDVHADHAHELRDRPTAIKGREASSHELVLGVELRVHGPPNLLLARQGSSVVQEVVRHVPRDVFTVIHVVPDALVLAGDRLWQLRVGVGPETEREYCGPDGVQSRHLVSRDPGAVHAVGEEEDGLVAVSAVGSFQQVEGLREAAQEARAARGRLVVKPCPDSSSVSRRHGVELLGVATSRVIDQDIVGLPAEEHNVDTVPGRERVQDLLCCVPCATPAVLLVHAEGSVEDDHDVLRTADSADVPGPVAGVEGAGDSGAPLGPWPAHVDRAGLIAVLQESHARWVVVFQPGDLLELPLCEARQAVRNLLRRSDLGGLARVCHGEDAEVDVVAGCALGARDRLPGARAGNAPRTAAGVHET
mmetsp:Transcript_25799/g.58780  ORF Transcript_25799/g.58780 Transcript_25799/m.58780 type:complete len:424 (-) Transcript_25799:632-1903(-)